MTPLLSLLIALGARMPMDSEYSSQVVLLRVTYQTWDEDRPWEKNDPDTRSCQAVVVDGNRLLVTAQMLADAIWIEAEKHGSGRHDGARIEHVDREINLALLAVDKPGFFDDLRPVQFAHGLPIGHPVQTVRWDDRRIEVFSSRIGGFDVVDSRYTSVEHLFLELTTDSSSGGWAEPVFLDGLLVGLTAWQKNRQAKAIPADILRTYVELATNGGAYIGFASFGNSVLWQTNRHSALSEYLGVDGEPHGTVIRRVPWGASGEGVLEPWDVLLEVDGHPINASGDYQHPEHGWMRFTNIAVDGHRPGDVLRARILRKGEPLEVEITLRRYRALRRLVPWIRESVPPPYVVAGGLVFRELDGEYLRTWSDWRAEAPGGLALAYQLEKHNQGPDRRRIIILSSVIPHPYNLGYHDLQDLIVQEINGHPIDSIADVEQALRAPVDGYHRIVFAPNYLHAEVVLDAESLESVTAEILRSYHISSAIRLPVEDSVEAGG